MIAETFFVIIFTSKLNTQKQYFNIISKSAWFPFDILFFELDDFGSGKILHFLHCRLDAENASTLPFMENDVTRWSFYFVGKRRLESFFQFFQERLTKVLDVVQWIARFCRNTVKSGETFFQKRRAPETNIVTNCRPKTSNVLPIVC